MFIGGAIGPQEYGLCDRLSEKVMNSSRLVGQINFKSGGGGEVVSKETIIYGSASVGKWNTKI